MLEVRAEIVDRSRTQRIAVRANRRFPGDYENSKSVPGGQWDPKEKYWHYPVATVTCRVLRQVYGHDLVIGPRLEIWARDKFKQVKMFQDVTARKDHPLKFVPQYAPIIDSAMTGRRSYQRVGAWFLAQTGRALIADDVSLGKTIQYLGGLAEARRLKGRHLVIGTQPSLETVWADEVFKWADGAAYPAVGGKPARKKIIANFFEDDVHDNGSFLIINPEMLRTVIKKHCTKCDMFEDKVEYRDLQGFPEEHWYDGHPEKNRIFKQDYPEIFAQDWDSIIVDEAHKYLLNLGKTQVGEGLIRLKESDGALRIAATATPMKGKPLNFWSIFRWLDPVNFSSKWDFAFQFLEVTDNGFGLSIGGVDPAREQFMYEMLAPVMLRRTKREVQPELPEPNYLDHWVRMSPKQEKQYAEFEEEGEADIEGGSLTLKGILAILTRQKQWAYGTWKMDTKGAMAPFESPKLEFLVDQLAHYGVTGDEKTDWIPEEGGFKHIIVSQFTSVLDHLASHLENNGIETMMITGSVTGKKRTSAIRRFQDKDDPCRVLLLNVVSGGAALTLDAWCDDMWILDETFVRDDMVQVEGRILNRDVEKRVAIRNFHYIRTKNTIEEKIYESGLTQDEFQQRILDGRRGVQSVDRRKS